MQTRHVPKLALVPLGLVLALASPPRFADAASAADPARGPLSGAHAVQITIAEKDTGELGLLIPLPDHPQGNLYPWSEAQVSRSREGESGFCRVRVRRGHQDPAHELELDIKCAHRNEATYDTDLRLETTHTFTKRKKSVVAEFSQPDGSATTVTVTAK